MGLGAHGQAARVILIQRQQLVALVCELCACEQVEIAPAAIALVVGENMVAGVFVKRPSAIVAVKHDLFQPPQRARLTVCNGMARGVIFSAPV